MAKIEIKLKNNHSVNGILYRSGIHKLDESILEKISSTDYEIIRKPKKKKTKDIKAEDKETVDIET